MIVLFVTDTINIAKLVAGKRWRHEETTRTKKKQKTNQQAKWANYLTRVSRREEWKSRQPGQQGKVAREFSQSLKERIVREKNQSITYCRKRARERQHSIKDKGKLRESRMFEVGWQLQTIRNRFSPPNAGNQSKQDQARGVV